MNRKPILLSILALGPACLLAAPAAADEVVVLEDPSGDDDGSGKVVYPTDAVYERGSFDLRKLTVDVDGDDTKLSIRLGTKVKDPWNSKEWDGNGFSVQMVFVFLDTDGKPGSGFDRGLPGLNVTFDPAGAWDRVVVLSPQPPKRIRSEIEQKAGEFAKAIVIPRKTRARGKEIFGLVKTADLGGKPTAGWGYQVVVQSNEGYPSPTDFLTRKVNEYEGPHRFGGGSDYDCDPHAIDILVAPAKGTDAEKAGQHEVLGAHVCKPDGSGTQAVLPMIVPARR